VLPPETLLLICTMSEEILVRLWARSCHGVLSFQRVHFSCLRCGPAYNIEHRSQSPEALEHLGPVERRTKSALTNSSIPARRRLRAGDGQTGTNPQVLVNALTVQVKSPPILNVGLPD